MVLNIKRVINLPVRTQSGTRLGSILGLDIETDTGRLTTVRVKAPGLIPHFMDMEKLVAWSQVISLNDKEMVVADGVIPVGSRFVVSGLPNHPA